MSNQDEHSLFGPNSRRRFLQQIGAAGLTGLAGPLLTQNLRGGTPEPAAANPIKHIVFLIQENHSYDTYFGTYAGNPAGIGFPSSYNNQGHKPHNFTSLSANNMDINHDWSTIHSEWANGAMTGFYSANGADALGYYNASQLSYYYSLAKEFTLCGMYFCSMLTETQPNRMCGFAGTSGGNCGDSISAGHYSSKTFPIIFDLLKEHNVTFKNYNWNEPKNYSYASLWTNWNNAPEINATFADFQTDLKNDTLPGVVYFSNNWQEHPGGSSEGAGTITQGVNQMKSIISKIMASKSWANTAIFLTYDEGGGFFDHVKPPQIAGEDPGPNGFGSLGVRVPCLVISPYALKNNVDTNNSEHSSVLKFIESTFGLPSLASVNKTFNNSTPSAGNSTSGAPFPPRDGAPLSIVSDMTKCFNFAQAPNLYPDVPGSPYYSKRQDRETSTLFTFGR